ncbi:hypothetical protein D3C75_757280 [compost metagenome]
MVGLGGNGPRALRVPQHQVGIGTHANRAFAWVEVEDLRRVGGRQRDELLHRKASAVHAFIPQHRHAVFDTGGAVGDLAEVVAASGFLLGAEAAVVGGGGVQVARLQAMPERLLMAAGAERRAHHVTGGGLPVRIAVDAVVQQQVPGQHFAVDRLALAPGVGDFVEGFLGRDVYQIQRRTQGFGDADRPARGLAFNL